MFLFLDQIFRFYWYILRFNLFSEYSLTLADIIFRILNILISFIA